MLPHIRLELQKKVRRTIKLGYVSEFLMLLHGSLMIWYLIKGAHFQAVINLIIALVNVFIYELCARKLVKHYTELSK